MKPVHEMELLSIFRTGIAVVAGLDHDEEFASTGKSGKTVQGRNYCSALMSALDEASHQQSGLLQGTITGVCQSHWAIVSEVHWLPCTP